VIEKGSSRLKAATLILSISGAVLLLILAHSTPSQPILELSALQNSSAAPQQIEDLEEQVIRGCTMIVVGKNATADGSIIIARNEDYAGNWAKHLIIVPHQHHSAGEQLCGATGFCFPLPQETYRYIAMEDWDTSGGLYHEAGINEKFVAVSATVTTKINSKVEEIDPLVERGVAEDIIATVVLSAASTAREGVLLVGKLVETYGATESFAMAVADPSEAWVIEVVSGHRWVAVRVPDNSYVVYGNELRICRVNLSDPSNFLGSPDLESFAVEKGLWNESKGPLCVAEAYGTEPSPSNYRRVWGIESLFTPSAHLDPEAKVYPYFIEPDKKLSIKDLMQALRYYYAGTPYDTRFNPNERGVGISRTIESHVIQLRGWMPVEIGGVMWVALSAPRASIYVPFYEGIEELPYEYTIGTDSYDSSSAFWAFRSVANIMFINATKYEPLVREKFDAYENFLIHSQESMESYALMLFGVDRNAALDFLSSYTKSAAEGAVSLARSVFSQLMTDLAKTEK